MAEYDILSALLTFIIGKADFGTVVVGFLVTWKTDLQLNRQ